ncbi:MAG TPA: hypothetical protein VLC30_14565 [Pseudomonas sp.]|nr:hypothetical protein [Pseudomonas sp.]
MIDMFHSLLSKISSTIARLGDALLPVGRVPYASLSSPARGQPQQWKTPIFIARVFRLQAPTAVRLFDEYGHFLHAALVHPLLMEPGCTAAGFRCADLLPAVEPILF